MRVSSEGLPWGSQVARIRLSLWVLEPLLVVMEPPPSCWTVGSMKAAFLPSPDAQWSWLTELYKSVECREREREAGGPTRIEGTWKLLGHLHEGTVFLSRHGVTLGTELLGTD